MTSVLFVVRDGGGTAPAELHVARRLAAHGHRVRVAGPPTIAAAATGLRFVPIADTAPVPLAAALPALLAGVDVLVADCLLPGALIAATVAGVPSVALLPTVYLADRLAGSALAAQPHWVRVRAAIDAARRAAGLPPVAGVAEQILAADRVLVLGSRAFELPDVHPPAHVEYVGAQPAAPARTTGGWRPPAGDRPVLLVSLSTEPQDQLGVLARLLAAIAPLPVHALVTVGPAIDPDRLDPPANVELARFVPHAEVLPHAAAVVTHAGHGTVLAALRAGVPLVCVPMGRDQYDVAARVRHHGAGIEVDAGADPATLTAAIRALLGDPRYGRAARRLAAAIAAEEAGRPDRAVAAVIETAARARSVPRAQ